MAPPVPNVFHLNQSLRCFQIVQNFKNSKFQIARSLPSQKYIQPPRSDIVFKISPLIVRPIPNSLNSRTFTITNHARQIHYLSDKFMCQTSNTRSQIELLAQSFVRFHFVLDKMKNLNLRSRQNVFWALLSSTDFYHNHDKLLDLDATRRQCYTINFDFSR